MSARLDDATLASGIVPDPFEVFDAWFAEAAASEINDPDAMTLATVDAEGMPDARTVLLKGRDEAGFVFYTNLESAKGRELAATPRAALLFHWKSLRRQVRIRGDVAQVSDAEADAYFASRPRGSRLGAWASDQSRPLDSRATLEARVQQQEARFPDEVPRPPHWSGLRVIPWQIEFWQDGAYRLHDRFLFTRAGDGWSVQRLYP
jgi:pyridoxamine 5'-phosphate oxidase